MSEKEKKDIQLSDHFTAGRLLRFAFPSIIMMVFTSIYGVVDGFFISNYAGKTAFAAVNLIMPFIMILMSLGFMIGTGGCALIGKTLGEGKRDRANKIFSLLVYTTIVLGIAIGVIGAVTAGPVAILLGADESMLDICVLYARISMISLPAVMLQLEFQSFFVVAEKPKLGLGVTLASGCMNILLDWLLVGAFGMGVAGAAIATAASEFVGGLTPLVYFFRKNTSLIRLGKTRFEIHPILKSMGNGSSEFVSNISMSLVSMLYNAQLMKFAGQDGVAAYGVLMYVNLIFISIFIGYSVGTAPVTSYHYGAGNTDELKGLLRKSLKIILVFAVAMLILGQLMAKPLSMLFVGYDQELMELTVRGFRIFSFTFLFASIPIYGSSFFTALNDGLTSAAISFLRTIVFQVGAVLIFPIFLGIDGIWFSIVAAEFVAVLVTVFFWITKQKKYGY